jgi:hypothetical protein
MAFGDTIVAAVLSGTSTPVDADGAANAITEGAAVNTTVGVAASSTANGAPVTYALVGDSSGGGFKIDPNTGVVTVADPSRIDFESAPGHAYTITTQASNGFSRPTTQTFTISVNDVAPSAPVDSNAAANSVLEGAANGTTVGVTASSTDVSGGAVTYSLIGDTSGGGFTVNATTGVVTVADGSKIDFESSAGHAYTITVQSSDGTLTSSQAFTINVGDVAMTTPVDSNGAANSVAEGAAAGTAVGITAQASDPSGPAPTYSLIGDTSGGGFTIHSTTGVITVANSAKIDFESSAPGHTYNITVQASNGVQTTSQVFTVGVTDVAPSAPTDSNGAGNSVAEGAAVGTVVGVTASSTDVNGGALTYSLIGDSSGGGFTINSTTGVITVANSAKIDYETAPGHAYTVTAQASDGTLSNSQTFTIGVTDVAPTAPVDANGATNTIAEGAANGSAVGVTASSTDINGPAVTYSLVGDTSGGGFTINSTTGVVTVGNSTKFDYETAAGHAYTVTAQASDGTLTNSQTFTIAVTDVAPSASADINGATNTIAEGAANGSIVGITASSTDPNGPAATYSLTDSAGGRFAINSTTGVVTVANGAAIDFESAPGHAYGITVQSTAGALSSTQNFTIAVGDVAPSAPTDVDGATNRVAEGAANGSAVGVTASSTDVNGPGVTYSLVGDTSGGGFTINSTTGVVTVANSTKLDYETTPTHAYTITAQASDGTLTNSQTFNIALTDVAASAPTDVNDATDTVAEGAANGSSVGITASSADPNGPAPTYSLTDDAGGRFAIDPGTGIVTVANGAAIDFETAVGHAYGITVQAMSGALSTTQNFSIGITDVAPSALIDNDGNTNSVFEGATNGTAVGITASFADPGGGPAPTFTLTDSAGGRFAINSTTGIVTVANGAAVDFETAPGPGHSYGITVLATAGAQSSTQNFSIGVGNVNEAPTGTHNIVTMLEGDSYTFSVEDFGFGDPSDIPQNSLQAVKMSTVPGAGAGTFTNNGVTVNTGDSVLATDIVASHLVFTPAAHSNGAPEASFTFQVQDNGGTAHGGVDLDQSANTLTINVNAVNDAPLNSVPLATQTVNEEGTLTFSSGTGNAITISDFDVGSGNETVTLSVSGGTLALGSTAGLASFTNNAGSIALTGTVANVNAAMDGLTYTGNLNFHGSDTLIVSTNDNGNTGVGGVKIDTDNVSVTVTAVNDPVTSSAPATLSLAEDASAAITGLAIADVDATLAPNGVYEVTLAATHGVLTLTIFTGLTFTGGDGTADASMTFHGTLSDINTALGTASYAGDANFNGSAQITLGVTDQFGATVATGSGAASNDSDNVSVTVTAVNDAPTVVNGNTATLAAINEDNTAGAETPISTIFGTHFSDAADAVTNGSSANGFAGIAIVGNAASGGQGVWEWRVAGNFATIFTGVSDTNAYLLTAGSPTTSIRFRPAPDFNGTAPALTVRLIDNSSGAVINGTSANASVNGGATRYSSDTIALSQTIVAVDDAPLNAAPGGVQALTPTSGETHLTQAQLDSVVAAAIANWAAAGASAAQLAMLAALTFIVADLAGTRVGEQTPGHILIDPSAAGHGWFVNSTPNDNSEFTHAANAAGTDLDTDPSNAAAGHLDLLTAVSHEMGHALGLDDKVSPTDAHDLMYINLVDGERRLPDATDVAEASGSAGAQAAEAALPLSAQAAADTPIVIGTAGSDTIDAGHGGAILFGGAGADDFVFGPATPLNAPTPAQVTHVADYDAAEGDSFDFSAITSAFHDSSVSDALVVRAVEDASGKFAMLQVDHIDPRGLPSAPNWVNVAQLDGAHAEDSVNVQIDSHSAVHLAQIHVGWLV